jgi:2-deoxy-D-gluconate 3-dehydrogenase
MTQKLFDLAGSTAVVTGASRGIGRALAIGLAEAGADIVGISRSFADGDGGLGKEIAKFGRSFKGYACDVADRKALLATIARIHAEGPPIDILINNAGTILRKPAAEHPDEYWDKIVETNLNSSFILAREFGAKMLERGRGKVVFIASLLTFQGGINVPSYAASKGGIGSLTMALSNEWAAKGVCVNAIAPGYIETDNTTALRADAERSASILSRIPAGRWGKPEDLVGAAVFLCSPAADYVSGHILTVDGGWMGR